MRIFRKKLIVTIGILLAAVLLVGLGKFLHLSRSEDVVFIEEEAEGSDWGNAPDFALSALTGETLRLSDFKGKVIILDFWAIRCPPCRMEIPHFIKLYDEYKKKGLVIIGVSLEDNLNKVGQFSERMGVNYPMVIANPKIVADYGPIQYIPTTFIIGREGKIKEKYIGYTLYEVFESEIKTLLIGGEDESK